jgi:G:T/U-mismatch repair DNA glycosylase
VIHHLHPYPPYLPEGLTRLIIGTIPPPRFSLGRLYAEDVDFCYGSKYGLLWPILERIFNLELDYENTGEAVEQRKTFLTKNKIGICDIVASCERAKPDASDLGMQDITTRDIVSVLREHKTIYSCLLMGGNSRNGPEYLLKKQLKSKGLALFPEDSGSIKSHRLQLEGREIMVYTLISPSSAANRSIGNSGAFKDQKAVRGDFTVMDFRIQQYKKVFL